VIDKQPASYGEFYRAQDNVQAATLVADRERETAKRVRYATDVAWRKMPAATVCVTLPDGKTQTIRAKQVRIVNGNLILADTDDCPVASFAAGSWASYARQ
jgi:hypothetical protein